jgi:hypothetical protein
MNLLIYKDWIPFFGTDEGFVEIERCKAEIYSVGGQKYDLRTLAKSLYASGLRFYPSNRDKRSIVIDTDLFMFKAPVLKKFEQDSGYEINTDYLINGNSDEKLMSLIVRDLINTGHTSLVCPDGTSVSFLRMIVDMSYPEAGNIWKYSKASGKMYVDNYNENLIYDISNTELNGDLVRKARFIDDVARLNSTGTFDLFKGDMLTCYENNQFRKVKLIEKLVEKKVLVSINNLINTSLELRYKAEDDNNYSIELAVVGLSNLVPGCKKSVYNANGDLIGSDGDFIQRNQLVKIVFHYCTDQTIWLHL